MSRLFGIALCALLLCALLPMVSAQVHAEADYPYKIDSANFPDETLRDIIRYAQEHNGEILRQGGKIVIDKEATGSRFFNPDGNDELSQAEAEAITTLDLYDAGIKDMTGIQLFTKVTYLDVGKNYMPTVDLSQFPALTVLWAENNNLTAIDLTKNTKLTQVYLYNDHLGALDISKNTKLEVLIVGNDEAGDNGLASLDLSKCPNLTDLNCANNRLTALDVSVVPGLVYLDCSDNSISTLSLTANTQLAELFCHRNKLTKLDISKTQLYQNDSTVHAFGANTTTVTVTMTQKQKDNYEATNSDTYKIEDLKVNTKVTVHVHTLKYETVRATLLKDGYKRKVCDCGYKQSKIVIPAVKTITLAKTTYTYDGSAKKPGVTVKDSQGNTLVKGTDYDLSYSSGRKSVGKYKVTVNLKGDYTGSKVLTFTIKPPKNVLSSVSAAKGGFTAKWTKKTTQTDGYVLCYAHKSDFSDKKTVTINSTKTLSKKVTGLKSGVKYYVRVSTYKVVNGTKICSAWSDVKTVKTK